MLALLTICVALGAVAGLVLLFVAYPYRGRSLPVAERLGDGVAAVADRIDPGEAPPQGVLGSPEAARRTRRRIERAEAKVTRKLHALGEVFSAGDGKEQAAPVGAGARHSREG